MYPFTSNESMNCCNHTALALAQTVSQSYIHVSYILILHNEYIIDYTSTVCGICSIVVVQLIALKLSALCFCNIEPVTCMAT